MSVYKYIHVHVRTFVVQVISLEKVSYTKTMIVGIVIIIRMKHTLVKMDTHTLIQLHCIQGVQQSFPGRPSSLLCIKAQQHNNNNYCGNLKVTTDLEF